MSTSAERMRRHRAAVARRTNGRLRSLTVLVPADRVPEFYQAAEMIRANGALEIRTLRCTVTGRIVGLRDRRVER